MSSGLSTGAHQRDAIYSDAIRSGEADLERAVSRTLGRLEFTWLAIDDEPGPDSLRSTIERNSIALLSNLDRPPLDPPSAGWLGRSSARARVRESHPWNQDYVNLSYDPGFLDVLSKLALR